MIEAKQTHCGKYRPYDDFHREWEVTTDLPEEEVIEWCFENLHKHRVPPSGEWHANIRSGGEKDGDYGYYFAGYYSIRKINGGYKFVICEPYAD